MKRLILKLSLFLFILLLIKAPFVYFYEDEFEHRRNAFAAQDFDTVFIGSSRTRLGVVPAYFDSLTLGKTKTYNFGVEGALPPQTLDWCEEFIENKSSLRNIFVELSGGINQIPIYEEPWKRFSLREYWRTLHSIDFSKLPAYHDRRAIGLFKEYFSGEYADYNVPLEIDFTKKELVPKKALNFEKIESSRKLNREIESVDVSDSAVNEYYWQRICQLIELAEAKQIRVYFFVPPRLEAETELAEIRPIFQRLSEKYKFRAAHDDESLYRDDASTDDFHLNYNGARRFTEFLAQEFNRRNF